MKNLLTFLFCFFGVSLGAQVDLRLGSKIFLPIEQSTEELASNQQSATTFSPLKRIPLKDYGIALYEIDEKSFVNFYTTKADEIQFSLSTPIGNLVFNLENVQKGIRPFWKGYLKGYKNKNAIFSISKNKIYGIFSVGEINYELSSANGMVILRVGNIEVPNCSTESTFFESDIVKKESVRNQNNTVRVSFDLDYDYIDLFNSQEEALDYFYIVWNTVKFLAERDGLNVDLATVNVWTFPIPIIYSVNVFDMLDRYTVFKPRWAYSGDICIYIGDNRTLSGADGIAGTVKGYCSSFDKSSLALVFMGNNLEFDSFPSYNSNVAILAHELGHLLGSHHTFQCAWGLPPVAIDNCGPIDNFCSTPPSPPNGGTIMGYCSDYNLLNGYGQLPSQRIQDRIASASCLRTKLFYESCHMDSSIFWVECISKTSLLTDSVAVKGIVFGQSGQTFTSIISNQNTGIVLDSQINLPYNQEIILAKWKHSEGNVILKFRDKTNEECSASNYIVIPNSCAPTPKPDLNLSVTTSNSAPPQWSNFSTTYTLTNEGQAPSHNIQVEAPIVQGIVYQGGNTHQANSGTFNSVADVWTVQSIAAGESATLTLNYFNLNTNPKKLFAQVTAMSGTDVDSSPGNNNTGIPTEDDEVSLDINGAGTPTCQISAQVSNILCSDNGTATDPLDDTFSFSLNVTGTDTGNQGWTNMVNGQNETGTYGTVKQLSGFSIASGNLSLNISDAEIPSCQTTISVQAPAACSNGSNPQPCASTSEFPWHEWIAGVKIGTFAQLSDKSYYSDYTNQKIDLTTGTATALTLTTGFSYFAYDEYWKVWIDLNGDGALDDATETVFQGKLNKPADGNTTHDIVGQITIPNGTTTGELLLRVSMKRAPNGQGSYPTPCEELPFGEVEDYTVKISTGNGNPQPCTSSSDFPWHEWISGVKIGTFEEISGKSSYSDFKGMSINATRGANLTLTLTTGFSYFTYDEYWKIWIDYNQDGAFDDATETAFQGIAPAPPIGTTSNALNGQISIPTTANLGNSTLLVSMKRVQNWQGSYPTPCETLEYGEVEEYTLNLVQAFTQGNKLVPPQKAQLEDTEEGILLYPNPTSKNIHIEWLGGAAEVQFMDATGRILQEKNAMDQLDMDVSEVSEGLYFVRIRVEGKRAIVRKVAVHRPY